MYLYIMSEPMLHLYESSIEYRARWEVEKRGLVPYFMYISWLLFVSQSVYHLPCIIPIVFGIKLDEP